QADEAGRDRPHRRAVVLCLCTPPTRDRRRHLRPRRDGRPCLSDQPLPFIRQRKALEVELMPTLRKLCQAPGCGDIAVTGSTYCPKCKAKSIARTDRKSTRLNSSHVKSSYAVFCLKKK